MCMPPITLIWSLLQGVLFRLISLKLSHFILSREWKTVSPAAPGSVPLGWVSGRVLQAPAVCVPPAVPSCWCHGQQQPVTSSLPTSHGSFFTIFLQWNTSEWIASPSPAEGGCPAMPAGAAPHISANHFSGISVIAEVQVLTTSLELSTSWRTAFPLDTHWLSAQWLLHPLFLYSLVLFMF